jgi:Trypsin
MPLKSLILAITIAIITSTVTVITSGRSETKKNPTSSQKPTIVLATDKPIADAPTQSTPFIPTNRTIDQGERGIICEPGQPPEECDERTPMKSRSYPWSAIGRLQIGEDAHCTATLINENWILTNAHCVIDEKSHKITSKSLTFLPNLIDGKLESEADRSNIIYVIAGTDFSDTDKPPHPEDWALLKLDQPLGKKYGTIGLKSIPTSLMIRNTKKFTLAGYSFDFPNTKKYPDFSAGPSFTAGVHEGCSFIGEQSDKVLLHNCDMRGGSSGGAIVAWIDEKPYIVAISNAEFANPKTGVGTKNYAINVTRVNDWFIKQERAKQP